MSFSFYAAPAVRGTDVSANRRLPARGIQGLRLGGFRAPEGALQGRGELREQPATGWWSGNDSNSPLRSVTTRGLVVAARAVPLAPQSVAPQGLVLLGLHEAGVHVVVRPEGVRRSRGVESGRAVLERQAHTRQLRLDLVDRLRTEVADVEQVRLGARDQLTHGVDALALEAVVGADGEFQLLDRERQIRGQGGVRRGRAHVDALGVDVQLAGQAEQLDQGLAGRRHGVTRPHGLLGLDIDDQLVEVGALLDTGRLDLVRDLEHRAVDGVDRDTADLLAQLLVLHGGDVAATALDGQLHLQLALAVQRGEDEVGVVHLDTGRGRDIGCGDQTRALLAQVHHDRLVVLRGDDQLLDVEDEVGDVLLDARHGGELVQDTVDPDAGDSRTGDRGEERTTQGVAEGVAEARLQRLDHEPGAELVDDLFGQRGTLSDQHEEIPSVVGARYLTPPVNTRVRAVRPFRVVPPHLRAATAA